jgi:hypothetical protein
VRSVAAHNGHYARVAAYLGHESPCALGFPLTLRHLK